MARTRQGRSSGEGCGGAQPSGVTTHGRCGAAVVGGRGCDDQSLVVEDGGHQSIGQDEAVDGGGWVTAGELGHQDRLERAVHDEAGIAFDVSGVVTVVVDAMRVVGQRGEAEEKVASGIDGPAPSQGMSQGMSQAPVGNLGVGSACVVGLTRARGRCRSESRLPVDDVLILLDDHPPVLADLVPDGHQGHRSGAPDLVVGAQDVASPCRRAADQKGADAPNRAAGPHPAPAGAWWDGNDTTYRVTVRSQLGCGGPVQQVDPTPQQRELLAGLEVRGRHVQKGLRGPVRVRG